MDGDIAPLDAAVEDDVDELEMLDSASRSQPLSVGEIYIAASIRVSAPHNTYLNALPALECDICEMHPKWTRVPAGPGADQGVRDTQRIQQHSSGGQHR